MKCDEVLSLLDSVFDEVGDSAACELVHHHLKTCKQCRLNWDANESIRLRLAKLKEITAPEAFVSRVRKDLAILGGIESGEQESGKSSITQELLREDIIAVMQNLSSRERDMLRLRFGLEDGEGRTLEQVAEIFGTTREEVRKVEAAALKKLRHPSKSRKQPDFYTDT